MKIRTSKTLAAAAVLAAFTGAAAAADWSDTSIGFRTGGKFAEPFNPNDISKKIISLTHVSGYKYGTNFFNADALQSDNKDMAVPGTGSGAQEVYVVYRNTVDLSKVTGTNYKSGMMRGLGVTFGFDWNAKNGDGYESKKRMLVLGPTIMFDVPGFLNVSLLELWESNAPLATNRYSYKTHPMLTASWGIPLGSSGFSYEGFINVIASKGKNEFGGSTAAETNFDSQIMYDMAGVMGTPKGSFKVGLEYQYWKNKFGNASSGAAGKGAFAKTPMLRAEYHF